MAAFFQRFNRHNYAIIGVESVAACKNLSRLIGVPGVDGVFIGPHDLTVSLEKPEAWDDPSFHSLIDDTVARCHAARIGVGVHVPGSIFTLARVQELIKNGMNWILDGADVVHAIDHLRARRQALGLARERAGASAAPASISTCAAAQRRPRRV